MAPLVRPPVLPLATVNGAAERTVAGVDEATVAVVEVRRTNFGIVLEVTAAAAAATADGGLLCDEGICTGTNPGGSLGTVTTFWATLPAPARSGALLALLAAYAGTVATSGGGDSDWMAAASVVGPLFAT